MRDNNYGPPVKHMDASVNVKEFGATAAIQGADPNAGVALDATALCSRLKEIFTDLGFKGYTYPERNIVKWQNADDLAWILAVNIKLFLE